MKRKPFAICSAGELYGGVEQFIFSFSSELKELKEDALVVLFHKGALYRKLTEAGIETHVFSGPKYDPRSIFKIADFFSRRDIALVHTNGYKADIICGLAAKLRGIPSVKTEHGMLEPAPSLAKQIKLNANINLARALSPRLFRAIVFVSEDLSKRVGPSWKRKYVIHNGIGNLPENGNVPGELSAADFNLGIVGRLSKIKGHVYLFQAIEKLREAYAIRLNVFGSGPLETALKGYCEQRGLTERVRFLGFRRDIYDCMAALKIFIMPSLNEGTPYALLEAMYLGLPIVASKVGGLKEILSDNNDALLVPPSDSDALARAILHIYENPEEGARLGANARRKVMQKYRIEHMAGKYLEVFREVLKGH